MKTGECLMAQHKLCPAAVLRKPELCSCGCHDDNGNLQRENSLGKMLTASP